LQIARNTSVGLWSFAWRKEKEGYDDAGVVEREHQCWIVELCVGRSLENRKSKLW
jgi:hypothetical protein